MINYIYIEKQFKDFTPCKWSCIAASCAWTENRHKQTLLPTYISQVAQASSVDTDLLGHYVQLTSNAFVKCAWYETWNSAQIIFFCSVDCLEFFATSLHTFQRLNCSLWNDKRALIWIHTWPAVVWSGLLESGQHGVEWLVAEWSADLSSLGDHFTEELMFNTYLLQ